MEYTVLLLIIALIVSFHSYKLPLRSVHYISSWQKSSIQMSDAGGELPRFRNQKFIPDTILKRIQDGTLSVQELDRIFNPSNRQLERMEHVLATGFMGITFALESGIVDVTKPYGYAMALLAGEIGQPTPDPKLVKDLIGSPFRDTIVALGWEVPPKQFIQVERRFYAILDLMLDKFPSLPKTGARELLSSVISDDNQVSILTSLPRDIAIKILKNSQLSGILEGKVNIDHLICYEIPTTSAAVVGKCYGDKFVQRQLIRCCSKMQSPTLLTVLIDANRRNIMCAKHLGLAAVAISGNALNAQFLRPADMVVRSLTPDALRLKDLYRLVQKAIRQEAGPEQQTDVVEARIPTTTLRTAAPAMDNPDVTREED